MHLRTDRGRRGNQHRTSVPWCRGRGWRRGTGLWITRFIPIHPLIILVIRLWFFGSLLGAVRYDDEFIRDEALSDQTSRLIVQLDYEPASCIRTGRDTRA